MDAKCGCEHGAGLTCLLIFQVAQAGACHPKERAGFDDDRKQSGVRREGIPSPSPGDVQRSGVVHHRCRAFLHRRVKKTGGGLMWPVQTNVFHFEDRALVHRSKAACYATSLVHVASCHDDIYDKSRTSHHEMFPFSFFSQVICVCTLVRIQTR